MKTFARFRNLTPYTIGLVKGRPFRTLLMLAQDPEHQDTLATYLATDPSGGRRDSIGLQVLGGQLLRDLDGTGVMFMLRLSKRNLPARVIQDRVAEMAADVEREAGRKPGRKERNAMAEDAELELLPRAFISHTYVPVIFTKDNRLFVFTGTRSKTDHILTFLVHMLTELRIEFTITALAASIENSIETWMTSKALGVNDDDGEIQVTNFAVMKADEISKIRVSDRSLAYKEVQTALTSGYRVSQIGLRHEKSQIGFRLDGDFVLRSITLGEDAAMEMKENAGDGDFDEVYAVAWLVATEMRNIVDDLIKDIRGAQDEEDEL